MSDNRATMVQRPLNDRWRVVLLSCVVLCCGCDLLDGAFDDGEPDDGFSQLAIGANHTCALDDDSRVWCRGANHYGQADAPAGEFEGVRAGPEHTCAIDTDRRLHCWGRNRQLQASPPAGEFVAVGPGFEHTCAIDTSDELVCWGRNDRGQAEPPEGEFRDVVAGRHHSCALDDAGAVACWGIDDGSDEDRGQARAPSRRLQQLVAGIDFTCGLDHQGLIRCWGADGSGQESIPDGEFEALAAGLFDACALDGDGAPHCWRVSTADETTLHEVDPPQENLAAIDVGASHGCGIDDDGQIRCWGKSTPIHEESIGELQQLTFGDQRICGIDDEGAIRCFGGEEPVEFPTDRSFVELAAGGKQVCAIDEQQHVHCRGGDESVLAMIPDGTFSSVAVGTSFGCAIKADDAEVVCWGGVPSDSESGSGVDVPDDIAERFADFHVDDIDAATDDADTADPPDAPSDSPDERVVDNAFGEPMAQISAAGRDVCGIDTSDRLHCLGHQSDDPDERVPGTYRDVATADGSVCAVESGGQIACWLLAEYGTTYFHPAATVPSGDDFAGVTTGPDHACALRENGELLCWGHHWRGQLDAPDARLQNLATGGDHTCGFDGENQLHCWGDLRYGRWQTPEKRPSETDKEVSTAPAEPLEKVTTGRGHNCLLDADQRVYCWGHDGFGQAASPAGAFLDLSAGAEHTCVVDDNRRIDCWGRDRAGEARPPDGEFNRVLAGRGFSCGIRTDDSIACWGDYAETDVYDSRLLYGGLHPTAVANTASPGPNRKPVVDLPAPDGSFERLAAGSRHACGIRPSGRVECWGADDDAVTQPPGGEFRRIDVGYAHACGLDTDGSIRCWGDVDIDPPEGEFDDLRVGTSTVCGIAVGEELDCSEVDDWRELDRDVRRQNTRDEHLCVLDTDGAIQCVGANRYGEGVDIRTRFDHFASGVATDSPSCGLDIEGQPRCWGTFSRLLRRTPARPPEGPLEAIDVGYDFLCAISEEGRIRCIGSDSDSEADVDDERAFIDLSVGHDHFCAIDADNELFCEGSNQPFSGLPTAPRRPLPDGDRKAEPPEGDFSQLSAGTDHTCGVTTDGAIRCWGSSIPQLRPPKTAHGRFEKVAAGHAHTCGLTESGRLLCWGADDFGQTDAPNGAFVEPAAGHSHTCAIDDSGDMVCWGAVNKRFRLDDAAFDRLSAGGTAACGIDTDDHLHCRGQMHRRGWAEKTR